MTRRYNTLMTWMVFIVTMVLFMESCATMNSDDVSKNYGTPSPIRSAFTATRARGGSINFDYLYLVPHDTSNAMFNMLFHVAESYCVIIDPQRGVLDTIDVRPSLGITSIDESNDSLIVAGKGFWTNSSAKEYTDLIFDVVLESQGKLYHDARRVRLEPSTEDQKASPLLYVQPFIDEATDSSVTFALLARRNRGASLDFFTTSEHIRVELLDANGHVVFASQNNAQFLQEVQPVEPLKREQYHRYTYVWNGKDNSGQGLARGSYTARLTLMTKPDPYVLTIPLEWKGTGGGR